MTNQEAIKWLSPDTSPAMVHKAEECGENPMGYINRAIELAIDVLSSPTQMPGTSDLISRQAAIDVICDCMCGEQKHECDGIGCSFNKALMELPSASQPEWIPCSERLPNRTERCFVTRYDEVSRTFFADILWYENDEWWNRLFAGDYKVFAWMPLLEPYKPEEE